MKILIANLSSKEIETVRGPAKVLHFRDAAANVWYDSFAGPWNAGWHDGTELEVEPGQIKRRVKNDREYLTLMPPPKVQGATMKAPEAATDPQVIALLKEIVTELRAIKGSLAGWGASPEALTEEERVACPPDDGAEPTGERNVHGLAITDDDVGF